MGGPASPAIKLKVEDTYTQSRAAVVGAETFVQFSLGGAARTVQATVQGNIVTALLPSNFPVGALSVQLLIRQPNQTAATSRALPEYVPKSSVLPTGTEVSGVVTSTQVNYLTFVLSRPGRDDAGVFKTGPGFITAIDPNSGERVAEVKLPDSVFVKGSPSTIVMTPDGSRAYVATSNGVYVLDAAAPRLLDGQWEGKDDQTIDPLRMGNGDAFKGVQYAIDNLVMDPFGQFLYAGVGQSNTVLVYDLRPDSASFHRVVSLIDVADQSNGGQLPYGQLNGMAISADGRRLYVAAARTTEYKNAFYDGWHTGAPVAEGDIVAINIDRNDAPADLSQNPRHYRKVIGVTKAGLDPFSVVTSQLDPSRVAFTSLLEVKRGFATAHVANDDPLKFTFDPVDRMSLGLSLSYTGASGPPRDARLDHSIWYASGLVILPDEGYAIVTNDIVVPANLAQFQLAAMRNVGSNIGLIRNPFGFAETDYGKRELLGATRPIGEGYSSTLALSADAQTVFVSFPGAEAVFAYSVPGLIDAARTKGPALQAVPIDVKWDGTPSRPIWSEGGTKISIVGGVIFVTIDRKVEARVAGLFDETQADENVFYGAIGISGMPVGVASARSEAALTLLGPSGNVDTDADTEEKLVFEWKVSSNVAAIKSVSTRLYVSSQKPGEGLWPTDPPRDRVDAEFQGLFDAAFGKIGTAPSLKVGDDVNPNRILTSGLLKTGARYRVTMSLAGGAQFELLGDAGDRTHTIVEVDPVLRKALTAGQRYYWGVRLEENSQPLSTRKVGIFDALPVGVFGKTYSSVTVLTHGFQFNPISGVLGGRFQEPAQFDAMGRLIVEASGGGVVLDYDKKSGKWVDRSRWNGEGDPPDSISGKNALLSGKAIVLVSDWVDESDIADSGFAEAAADALFASIVDTAIFFSLAFAGTDMPWVTLALGDLGVKLAIALFALVPFRVALALVRPSA